MAKFKFLINKGSPTRWDAGKYPEYCDRIANFLPECLVELMSEERYIPGGGRSLWAGDLTHLSANGRDIVICFKGDSENYFFSFVYSGVKKVVVDRMMISSNPVLIVQELVVLRDGTYRHALSDLGGNVTVIFAEELKFFHGQELIIDPPS